MRNRRIWMSDLSRVNLSLGKILKCRVNVEKASRVHERTSVAFEVAEVSLPFEKPANLWHVSVPIYLRIWKHKTPSYIDCDELNFWRGGCGNWNLQGTDEIMRVTRRVSAKRRASAKGILGFWSKAVFPSDLGGGGDGATDSTPMVSLFFNLLPPISVLLFFHDQRPQFLFLSNFYFWASSHGLTGFFHSKKNKKGFFLHPTFSIPATTSYIKIIKLIMEAVLFIVAATVFTSPSTPIHFHETNSLRTFFFSVFLFFL